MKQPACNRLVAIVGCILSLTSCVKERTAAEMDASLQTDFKKMDAFLRNTSFDSDSLETFLENIEHDFIHSETKSAAIDTRSSAVRYKWNSDSTTAFLRAHKTFPKGFSRERIIHSGDSILFIHRFSTQPLGIGNSDYTFLESVHYLAQNGTIRYLARIQYDQQDLADTLQFRKMPFEDMNDEILHYYSLELNYSRDIFN